MAICKKINLGYSKAIVELTPKELKPGNLWRIYKEGAKAIHLIKDDRVEYLWAGITDPKNSNHDRPFWENSITSFARNHIKSQMDVGDLLRFSPGNWGHIARKVVVYSKSDNGKITTIPEKFWSEDEEQMFPLEFLQIAWELASDVFKSSLPVNYNCPEYAVSVELLKYPDSLSDLKALFNLLEDSDAGRWTKIGRKLDADRAKVLASHPFDKNLISKLYRHASMIPGINFFLHLLNKSLYRNYTYSKDLDIIAPQHIDAIRSFTLLAGDREAIVTEIFDGNQWHEIALTPKSLHMFPGNLLSKELGLEPTIHRYSLKKEVSDNNTIPPKPNLSLLLGLVDPKTFKPLAHM
jgi:hypothetical protein